MVTGKFYEIHTGLIQYVVTQLFILQLCLFIFQTGDLIFMGTSM